MISLRDARKDAGFTLVQLSAATGINYRQLIRYERGESSIENMTFKNAILLSDALGIDPHELI